VNRESFAREHRLDEPDEIHDAHQQDEHGDLGQEWGAAISRESGVNGNANGRAG
jgi:hypothetical protein